MKVDMNLLDMQRRALTALVVENQLPTANQRDDLEGLLEFVHALADAYDEYASLGVHLEFVDEIA